MPERRRRFDSKRIGRALEFALDRHEEPRKGKNEPYATHLLRVASLVMQLDGDSTQVTAALLHDTIEDTDTTEPELRRRFGARIANMVRVLSETRDKDAADGKGLFRERKEAYLAQLRRADRRTRLVAACDKLDNLRDIVKDLASHGTPFLKRFSGTPRQTRWYYEQAYEAVGDALPTAQRREFRKRLRKLAKYIREASPDP